MKALESRPRQESTAAPHPVIRRRPRSPHKPLGELRDRFEKMQERVQHVVDEYVPHDVQKEAHRKGFHMTSGILATPLVLYTGLVYTTAAAIVTLIVIASLELLLARYRLAVPFVTHQLTATRRPGEVFSWASIMFIVAALIILWLTPLPVALAALAMLGLGDGMSALVGRMTGKNKLWYNPKKSWEGSTAGFLAGAIGALGLTAWYYAAAGQPYPFVALVPISIAGALAAAIAESLPQWEDNFSVPIASSVTMTILWMTTGLSPGYGPLIQILIDGGLQI